MGRTAQNESLLDEPAIVAVRRVALALADRAASRWHELTAAEPGERAPDQAAGEALHDFRVALRSLRSWLRAHDDVIPLSRKTIRRLRDCAAATSALRDAEVLAVHLSALTFPSRRGGAAARWWTSRLLSEANNTEHLVAIAADVDRGLAAVAAAAGTVRWKQPVSEAWRFPSLAAELAPRVRRQAAVLRRRLEASNDPAAIEGQHRARIAAKHLRYLLEPIESELPEARLARKHLKGLQDALGELHDFQVALKALAGAVEARAADEASQRGREVLAATAERRPIRRGSSLLSGFRELSNALEAAADDAYLSFEKGWLVDGADVLFATIDTAVAALALRGGAGVEIERKLLLDAWPEPPADSVVSVVEIDQGYLPGRKIAERVRRIARDGEMRYVRTIKAGAGLVRTEIEETIDATLFERLWALTDGRRVRKRRTVVADANQTWEIDQFLDRDLVVAEIELATPDADATPPPWLEPFVVRDVTDEVAYSNARLAR